LFSILWKSKKFIFGHISLAFTYSAAPQTDIEPRHPGPHSPLQMFDFSYYFYTWKLTAGRNSYFPLPGVVICHSPGIVSLSLDFLALFWLLPSSNDAVHEKDTDRSRHSSHRVGVNAKEVPTSGSLRAIIQRKTILFAPSSRESRDKIHWYDASVYGQHKKAVLIQLQPTPFFPQKSRTGVL
jgi:hypothetical protein